MGSGTPRSRRRQGAPGQSRQVWSGVGPATKRACSRGPQPDCWASGAAAQAVGGWQSRAVRLGKWLWPSARSLHSTCHRERFARQPCARQPHLCRRLTAIT